MPSSGYTAITFVANEQPTTAKWNLIGSNDASFNNGNGIEDSAILTRHLNNDAVTSDKINVIPVTDANGWSVYDFGSFHMYTKRFTGNQGSINADVEVALLSGTAPPVAVANPSAAGVFVQSSLSVAAYISTFKGNIRLNASTIDYYARNVSNGVAVPGVWILSMTIFTAS